MRAKSYLVSLLFVLFTSTLFAQSNSISGKVLFIDKGVKGATIELSGNSKNVTTDKEGKFTVDINRLPLKIKVRYKRIVKEVLINDKSFVNINLVPKEKKLYRLINEKPDIFRCELFLKEYPNGVYSSKILELKEELTFVNAYDNAVESFNVDKLEEYLLKYPEGKFLDKAKKMIEITIWQIACKENTIDAYREYLNKYPNGIAAKLAKGKVAKLENK